MVNRVEINIHNEGKLEYVKPLVFNADTYAAAEQAARTYLTALPDESKGETK